MSEILNTENLVDLHEKLNEFAQHHHNKGGQAAHKLIKTEIETLKSSPRQADREEYYEGWDDAVRYILRLLHDNFVP